MHKKENCSVCCAVIYSTSPSFTSLIRNQLERKSTRGRRSKATQKQGSQTSRGTKQLTGRGGTAHALPAGEGLTRSARGKFVIQVRCLRVLLPWALAEEAVEGMCLN